jgi:hypothetical protein
MNFAKKRLSKVALLKQIESDLKDVANLQLEKTPAKSWKKILNGK